MDRLKGNYTERRIRWIEIKDVRRRRRRLSNDRGKWKMNELECRRGNCHAEEKCERGEMRMEIIRIVKDQTDVLFMYIEKKEYNFLKRLLSDFIHF